MDYTKKIRSLKYNGVPMPLAEGKIEIPVPTGWERITSIKYYQINNYEFIITYNNTTGTYYVNTITKETIKLSDAGSGSAGFYEENNYVFILVGSSLKNLIIFDKTTKEFNEVTAPVNISLTYLFLVDNNVAYITDTGLGSYFSKITITDIDNITIERITVPGGVAQSFLGTNGSQVIQLEDKCVFFGQKGTGGNLYKIEIDKTNNYAISSIETEIPRMVSIGYSNVKTNKNYYYVADKNLLRYNYEDDEVTLLKSIGESNWSLEEIYDVTINTVGGQNKVELTENLLLHKSPVNSSNPMVYYDASNEELIDIAVSTNFGTVYNKSSKLFRIDNCLFAFKFYTSSSSVYGLSGKIDFSEASPTLIPLTTSYGSPYFVDYYFNSQNKFFMLTPSAVYKYNNTDNDFEMVQRSYNPISDARYFLYINPKTSKFQNNIFVSLVTNDNGLWYNLETGVGGYFMAQPKRGYEETIINDEYVLIVYGASEVSENRFTLNVDRQTITIINYVSDWLDDGFVPIEETQPQTPEVTVQPNDAGGNTIIIGG